MEIKVGDFDVLESGTIVGIIDEPIEFLLSKETDFRIKIIFKDDKTLTDKPHNRKADVYGKNGLQITFTNYNYPNGIGNAKPVQLGQIENRELHLTYRVYSLVDSGKLFHYTWLLGKEVNNGK